MELVGEKINGMKLKRSKSDGGNVAKWRNFPRLEFRTWLEVEETEPVLTCSRERWKSSAKQQRKLFDKYKCNESQSG